MPRIPIFRLGQAPAQPDPPRLASYKPSLSLEGLQVGVDNLRQDVYLSPRFVDTARSQIAHLIARHGEVEGLLAAEGAIIVPQQKRFASSPAAALRKPQELADLKPLLTELQLATLNRAKAQGNLAVDVLGRLALIKFLRLELSTQFAQVLERCRMMLRGFEGTRQQKALEYRERLAGFQVRKKIILRKTGQELFQKLREIEKETLARTRRSLFGQECNTDYRLFLNRLIFTEDGRDDYICAEHYVMFGNFDRDPDRFANMRNIACQFLRSLSIDGEAYDEGMLDGWLCMPENAEELVGGGRPDDSTPQGQAQKTRLEMWLTLLENENVMEQVIASYEVVPLLAEYAPRINAQQLKNALVSRAECDRVEKLIEQHGKLSSKSLYAAVGRVVSCRGAERANIAGRFLRDLMRYHRDLRRLETLNAAMDSVNLIANEKLRELSAVNGTLYDFLSGDEQKPSEAKILHHVVLKADIRDSSRLTRSLFERGLNAASYFTLNFYDPVNKLLPKYGADKVFLEGDAIILAILERENEPAQAVSRACVLAREIIEIVQGYNELLERAGLPGLELGIGIAYQNSAPLYLMDGAQRIMISEALNESDRLSSCNKRARKVMEPLNSPFRVYTFLTASNADADDSEEFTINYNVGGIRMNEAAFHKLKTEISLEPCQIEYPALWGSEKTRLHSGLVPLNSDIFRRIVVRETSSPEIDPRNFSLVTWTEKLYYEVCTDPTVYTQLEGEKAAKQGK